MGRVDLWMRRRELFFIFGVSVAHVKAISSVFTYSSHANDTVMIYLVIVVGVSVTPPSTPPLRAAPSQCFSLGVLHVLHSSKQLDAPKLMHHVFLTLPHTFIKCSVFLFVLDIFSIALYITCSTSRLWHNTRKNPISIVCVFHFE